ncbi:3-deoxy-D-manno-octulosonic acid transferase [Desulfoplanes formicivorans]|uniref:3-deoxy-D-manno-octulosonic acid transferase n=1 Tax=Desulfoplanes formicivorans TaxID=1592317 RepID=A0A194AG56_9BACT|nr:glycosyltransferase N-terminal domain-containing protein [Desulfoplanes formicivorans]GAU09062.1 3-deoxy-D-manno-octulosonic-acid transferase [Desulfoplanes formicivorans]
MKTSLFLGLYTLLWTLALPLVFLNKRLREHWFARLGWSIGRKHHDIWMQAASVGEAFLAISLADHLAREHPELSVLITTNTSQGYDILTEHARKCPEATRPAISICPLDHPWIISRFMRRTTPGAVVLLETELWPGILGYCKRHKCPVLVANARMSPTSFAGYMPLSPILESLGPTDIMAISSADGARFSLLFKDARVTTMPNIKFDRIGENPTIPYVANPLSRFFRPSAKLVALGSIREEEEPVISAAITQLVSHHPATIIALVPRHQHRISAWKTFLKSTSISWVLRSKLVGPVKPGTVVLWDRFGELQHIYALAKTAFVGGSLAPLGGQNFLEPLAQGVCPVIGPFWKNFHWVGQELIDQGLVTVVSDHQQLANELGAAASMSREKVRAAAEAYLASRRGGTALVGARIASLLNL